MSNIPLDDSLAQLGPWMYMKYVDAAMLVYLIADYFQTVEDEVTYIWSDSQKWGVTRLLFLLTRYLPFLDVPVLVYQSEGWRFPDNFFEEAGCTQYVLTFVFATGILANAVAEAIMTIRVHALSKGQKWAGIWLAAQYLLVQGGCFATTGIMLYRAVGGGRWSCPSLALLDDRGITKAIFVTIEDGWEGAHGLGVTTGPTTIFSITLGNQIILTCLGFYFLRTNFKHLKGPLVSTISRGGMVYFLVMTAVDTGCLILSRTVLIGPSGGMLLLAVQRVFHATLTSRIVIDIRSAAGQHIVNPSIPLSELEFAELPQYTITSGGKILAKPRPYSSYLEL